MPTFKKKPGAHIRGDVQEIGEALQRLQNNGEITPEAIVEAARLRSSPLHGCFEWDDTVAAREYRLSQARYLIRSVVVETPTSDGPIEFRAYVSIAGDDAEEDAPPRRYMVIEKAMRDYSEEVLDIALKELKHFKEKYKALRQLQVVFAAIDAVGVK